MTNIDHIANRLKNFLEDYKEAEKRKFGRDWKYFLVIDGNGKSAKLFVDGELFSIAKSNPPDAVKNLLCLYDELLRYGIDGAAFKWKTLEQKLKNNEIP